MSTAGSVNAQPGPKKLGFTVSLDKADPKIGDTVVITFKAPIPAGFHVYSEKSDCPADDGPQRAEMRFNHSDAIIFIDGITGVGDVMVNDTEIWKCTTGEFDKVCEFRQKIVVTGELQDLVATFMGQQCSMADGVCYQVDEEIKIPITVAK
jgi:hypothetical protein